MHLTLCVACLSVACWAAGCGYADWDIPSDDANDASAGTGRSKETDRNPEDGGDAGSQADVTAPPLDANGNLNTLYAHIAGTLGRFNLADGTFVEIGNTGSADIVLGWDPKERVMRVITDFYTAPAIGTIDLCTGTIAAGPRMKIGSTSLQVAETLAFDAATGKFFTAVDADRSGTISSETLGTVDITSGATSTIGRFGTVPDCDSMTFVGSALYGIDNTQIDRTVVYTANTANAAVTRQFDVDASVVRLAYDPTRDVLFAGISSRDQKIRRVAQLDRTSGTLSPVGNGIPESKYVGATIGALVSAPAPACP